VQAARLGAALGEARPIVKPLPRRAAIAAAGELAEAVERHALRLEAELEAVDLAKVGGLGVGREMEAENHEHSL
jgi:hypothetical protein